MALKMDSKVLQPKHLRLLVFSSFFLVVLLVCLFIFRPAYLDFEITRYLLLIIVSIFIALLFFILWPHNAILEKIPQFEVPVKVAGPVVLWVLVFMLLNSILPKDINQTKLFEVLAGSENSEVQFDSNMLLVNKTNSQKINYKLIEDLNKKTHLWGMVIEFPNGLTSFEAEVSLEPYERFRLVFDRSKSIIEFPVLVLKKL